MAGKNYRWARGIRAKVVSLWTVAFLLTLIASLAPVSRLVADTPTMPAQKAMAEPLPVAISGILDFSHVDQDRFSRPLTLQGDWSMASGLLLMPEDWSLLQTALGTAIFGQQESFRRFGGFDVRRQQSTWRLLIELPESGPPLALVMPPLPGAWQVYVNGQPFLQAGKPGVSRDDEIATLAARRLRQLPPGQRQIEILIQTSNHLAMGYRETLPYIQHHAVAIHAEKLTMLFYYLVSGLVVALALVSLLMWLGRQQGMGYFWFFLLLLNAVAYILVANDMVGRILPGFTDRFVVRMTVFPVFFGLSLLIPFYGQYCRHAGLVPKGFLTRPLVILAGRGLSLFFLLAAFFCLFLPLSVVLAMSYWLVIPAMPVVAWVLVAIFQAQKDNIPGARIAMTGALVLLVFTGFDLAAWLRGAGTGFNMFPAGLVFFVITHAVGTARRYESAYALAEGQNRALRRTNTGLENQIGQDRVALDKSSRDLVRLAIRDEVTGLYTRPQFMRQAAREFLRARRFQRQMAVAIVQIDRHAELLAENGEEYSVSITRETVRRLESVTRDTDIAGLAGEGNIGLVLPETSLAEASDLCALMQAVLRRDVIGYSGDDQPVTVSIAVSAITDFDIDMSSITMRVDRALEGLTAKGGDGLTVRAGMQLAAGERA